MRIVITSDFHGYLPEAMPSGDLLLLCGDIAPDWKYDFGELQLHWLQNKFRPWLEAQHFDHVVATPGNHDWWAETLLEEVDLPWQLLIDSACFYQGLKIWGCPWSRTFFNWAFMKDKLPLARVHDDIEDCDILLSHGPCYGFGDQTYDNRHVGAMSLNNAVRRIKPGLVVTGHIHENPGVWTLGNSLIMNQCYVDGRYRPGREPRIFDWEI